MSPPTPPPPPPPPPRPGEGAGRVDPVVAGLARELDGLRRTLDPLEGVPGRVDELAGLVAQLADAVTALTARKGPTPCPSWLTHPTSPAATAATLAELGEWLRVVYLRYPDAASGLPECWLWHPDVVEELLWLEHAWLSAYQGRTAAVGLAADWHDRQRPGVVRRIRQTAGSCSRERHQTRPGWNPPSGAPTVPGADALAVIADWWGSDREHPAPEPDHVHGQFSGRPA